MNARLRDNGAWQLVDSAVDADLAGLLFSFFFASCGSFRSIQWGKWLLQGMAITSCMSYCRRGEKKAEKWIEKTKARRKRDSREIFEDGEEEEQEGRLKKSRCGERKG